MVDPVVCEATRVVFRPPHQDIEVAGKARRSVYRQRVRAHDHELNAVIVQ
jgi:hypothetical protein